MGKLVMTRWGAFLGMTGFIAWVAAAPLAADWKEGEAAFREGRWARAAASFRAVTAAHDEYAPAHFMLGRSLSRLGKPGEAVASLERAAELEAGNVQYALALGEAHLKAGTPDAALAVLARHTAADFGERLLEPFERVLASAAVAATDGEKALAALDYALDVTPRAGRLWFAKGRVLAAAGRPGSGFEAFQRAYSLDPASFDSGRRALSAAVVAAHGASGAERGAWLRRGAELGERAGIEAADPQLLAAAGDAWLEAGEPARARVALDQAAVLAPKDAGVAYKLGRCALAQEETQEALALLMAALDLGPDEELRGRILGSVGYAHRLREDFVAAAEAYRRAGRSDKVLEMEQLAAIAAGNREYERLAADCRNRQQRYAATRAEARGKLGPADLAALDLEIARKMTDCRPYLESVG